LVACVVVGCTLDGRLNNASEYNEIKIATLKA
jgi:hypothetical protein